MNTECGCIFICRYILMDPQAQGSTGWVMPNKTGFLNWMYNKFKALPPTDESENSCACVKGAVGATGPHSAACKAKKPIEAKKHSFVAPHQQFVADVLHVKTPYRGLLLYHGLGTGKTAASLAAAESHVNKNRKVFVMLPASLEPNYRKEIMKITYLGRQKKGKWCLVESPTESVVNAIIDATGMSKAWLLKYMKKHENRVWLPERMVTGSHSKPGTTPQAPAVKIPFTSTKTVRQMTDDADKGIVSDVMDHIIDQKYTFIKYNGISLKRVESMSPKTFDNSIVVIDEAHNFMLRVANNSPIAKKLYTLLMGAKGMKIILLSGTPMINHPFELCRTLNLVRGPMVVNEAAFMSKGVIPLLHDVQKVLKDSKLSSYIDTVNIPLDGSAIRFTLLPYGYQHVDGTGGANVTYKRWAVPPSEITDDIYKVLAASFNTSKKKSTTTGYALPDTKEEFIETFLNIDPNDYTKVELKNEDLFMRRVMGLVSYYKTAGENMFPKLEPTAIHKLSMPTFQFSAYKEARDKERKMESKSKKSAPNSLFADKGQVYRAFSRMVSNFVFPEEIKRPDMKTIRDIMKVELSGDGDDGGSNANDGEPAAHDANSKAINNVAHKKYDASLIKAMADLRKDRDTYLTVHELLDKYSPKFGRIVQSVTASPGPALFYSQFRTIEGIGVMILALEAAGYIEIKVSKSNGDGKWHIADQDQVLDPKYNGKRFIVFPDDRDKTDILLALYNGRFDESDVSPELKAALGGAGLKNNLHGEAVKLLMITQSGAEGISLRNVRQVEICEPFWNQIRIDQVIGRAVRTCSHQDLPLEERVVNVNMYAMKLTEEQLKEPTLRNKDNSQTTDEHIFEVANKKQRVIQKFLDLLKSASLDCARNASVNRPLLTGACYAFHVNAPGHTDAFSPIFQEDVRDVHTKRMQRLDNWSGVVMEENGVPVVSHDGTKFDVQAWKNAGVAFKTTL
jgi:hypothetical protein